MAEAFPSDKTGTYAPEEVGRSLESRLRVYLPSAPDSDMRMTRFSSRHVVNGVAQVRLQRDFHGLGRETTTSTDLETEKDEKRHEGDR